MGIIHNVDYEGLPEGENPYEELVCPKCKGITWIFSGVKKCMNPYCPSLAISKFEQIFIGRDNSSPTNGVRPVEKKEFEGSK